MPDRLPVTTRPVIDSAAILEASGFERCPGLGYPLEGDLGAERGQELLDAVFAAGIASGGSPGGEGQLPYVDLYVLDEPSLATLAKLADPSELCVNGADPNDYSALGPQALSGPGWRWVGAGSAVAYGNRSTIVDNQDDYDRLWTILGEGPETGQVGVDFDTQVILTFSHLSGVNFGACGFRFDGYGIDDKGVVVLDFVQPGGDVVCPAEARPAVYAVALERRFVGEIPFAAVIRSSPLALPTSLDLTIGVPEPAPVLTAEEVSQEPPSTTTVPALLPTVPPVDGSFAAGAVSVPVFGLRAGSTEPGGVDLPVPEAWQADPSGAMVDVAGRGGLHVATFDADDPGWRIMADPAELEITEGPTAIAVPLYRATSDGIVTTGASGSIQQYRHGSDDSNTWLRRVVWVYPHDDLVTVVVLGYPEFPEGSSFDTDDPLQTSLAGQDPLTIMGDIRFFSPN